MTFARSYYDIRNHCDCNVFLILTKTGSSNGAINDMPTSGVAVYFSRSVDNNDATSHSVTKCHKVLFLIKKTYPFLYWFVGWFVGWFVDNNDAASHSAFVLTGNISILAIILAALFGQLGELFTKKQWLVVDYCCGRRVYKKVICTILLCRFVYHFG